MKISKLFHWLYAIVMLLPIFAIATTCLVQTFNQNAKQQEEAQLNITYKYETNDINSVNDLVIGNIYELNTNNTNIQPSNLTISDNLNFEFISGSFVFESYEDNYSDIDTSIPLTKGIEFLLLSNNSIDINYPNSDYYFELTFLDVQFRCDCIVKLNYFNSESLSSELLDYISSTTYNEIESVEIEQKPLDENVFYRAVDRVTQSPLFNWAYNSFLVTPFAYIVNLFSMPTNSPIVMFLSYWLAISIIWLVFDLIMYVPLLVHRWLDKGVLE